MRMTVRLNTKITDERVRVLYSVVGMILVTGIVLLASGVWVPVTAADKNSGSFFI